MTVQKALEPSKLGVLCLARKEVTLDGIFARKVWNTNWSVYIRLEITYFVIFYPPMNTLL